MRKIKLLVCAVVAATMFYGCGDSLNQYTYNVNGTFQVIVGGNVTKSDKYDSSSYNARQILRDALIHEENSPNDASIQGTQSRTMLEFVCNVTGGGNIKFILGISSVPDYISNSDIDSALRKAMGQFIKEYYYNSYPTGNLVGIGPEDIVVSIGYDD